MGPWPTGPAEVRQRLKSSRPLLNRACQCIERRRCTLSAGTSMFRCTRVPSASAAGFRLGWRRHTHVLQPSLSAWCVDNWCGHVSSFVYCSIPAWRRVFYSPKCLHILTWNWWLVGSAECEVEESDAGGTIRGTARSRSRCRNTV